MNRFTLAVVISIAMARAAVAETKKVDFVKDVQPILKASCVDCHSLDPKKPKKNGAGSLRLDDKASALKGGKYGADIVPGDAKNSRLFKLLSGSVTEKVEDEDKDVPPMPKAKRGKKWRPLTGDQIATIRQWIDQGADWPEATTVSR